jgi:hypothetical protein
MSSATPWRIGASSNAGSCERVAPGHWSGSKTDAACNAGKSMPG